MSMLVSTCIKLADVQRCAKNIVELYNSTTVGALSCNWFEGKRVD